MKIIWQKKRNNKYDKNKASIERLIKNLEKSQKQRKAAEQSKIDEEIQKKREEQK